MVAKMSQMCPFFNSVVACIANPMSSGCEANSPDSKIKKIAPVSMLRGSDSVAQLSQQLSPLFLPVVTVVSKQCR